MREARCRLYNATIATEALKSQRKIVRNFTRLTVTTCLYLSPSNKARSLSTLIAVVVAKDTPLNAKTAIRKRIQKVKQKIEFFGEKENALKRGWQMRFITKSVHARQLRRNFDGG